MSPGHTGVFYEVLGGFEGVGRVNGAITARPFDQIWSKCSVTLNPHTPFFIFFSVRSAERSHSEVCAELSEQRGKTLEEKKKRELQDTLVRRLQKRLILLSKVTPTVGARNLWLSHRRKQKRDDDF